MQTAVVEDAFARYRGDLYRFLLRRTGNHTDAEELTQQVFADAASSFASADPPRSMRGWLYTVAERRLVDELRRRTRAAEVARVLAAERPPGGETPERVEEAVARLPLLQRRLVFMRIVEERPVSRDRARARLQRGGVQDAAFARAAAASERAARAFVTDL
jgi:RNA polymerase sigma-70 factor (ECF subfamily)